MRWERKAEIWESFALLGLIFMWRETLLGQVHSDIFKTYQASNSLIKIQTNNYQSTYLIILFVIKHTNTNN